MKRDTKWDKRSQDKKEEEVVNNGCKVLGGSNGAEEGIRASKAWQSDHQVGRGVVKDQLQNSTHFELSFLFFPLYTYLFPPLSLYPSLQEEPHHKRSSCSGLVPARGPSPSPWTRRPQLAFACSFGSPWLWVCGRACGPYSEPLLGSARKWEKTQVKRTKQETIQSIICRKVWSSRAINAKIHAWIFGVAQASRRGSVSSW